MSLSILIMLILIDWGFLLATKQIPTTESHHYELSVVFAIVYVGILAITQREGQLRKPL